MRKTWCSSKTPRIVAFNSRADAVQNGSAYNANGRAQLAQLAADAKTLAGEAPAALHNDMDALAKYVGIAATRPTTSAEDDAIQAAGDRVDAYLSSKCNGSAVASDPSSSQTTSCWPSPVSLPHAVPKLAQV